MYSNDYVDFDAPSLEDFEKCEAEYSAIRARNRKRLDEAAATLEAAQKAVHEAEIEEATAQNAFEVSSDLRLRDLEIRRAAYHAALQVRRDARRACDRAESRVAEVTMDYLEIEY